MPMTHHFKVTSGALAEADALLVGWGAVSAGATVLALVPEPEKEKIPALQSMAHDAGLRLVGAVFPAIIDRTNFCREGFCFVLLDPTVQSFLLSDVSADPVVAASDVASIARGQLEAAGSSESLVPPTLYLIFDSQIGNVASILESLYLELADQVCYAGVCAGSETFQPMACLFDDRQFLGNGVLCLLLPGQVRTVLEHGFSLPERVMTASSTEGNLIQSIDWQPAFDAYRSLMEQEFGIALTPENFYAHAVHFPFGILRANAEVAVRIPVALSPEGAVYCVGEVPENAMLAVLKAPEANAGGCIEHLAQHLMNAMKESSAAQTGGILTFYCAGRKMHLGDQATQELETLQRSTHASLLAGALSLGEIGSTEIGGYPLFHNATLVCSLLP